MSENANTVSRFAESSIPTTNTPLPALFTALSQSDEFEARKQRLLDELAAGGVEVGPETGNKSQVSMQLQTQPDMPVASMESHTTVNFDEISTIIPRAMDKLQEHTQHTSPNINGSSLVIKETAFVDPVVSAQPEATSQASPVPEAATLNSCVPLAPTPITKLAESAEGSERRSRLNVSAVQRMLFGSLGKRAPKSKLDQDKLRSDFMKDVRPIVAPKQPHEEQVQETASQEDDENPDSWKDKINYRAVECCHEGIELSVPPFPFVQRWDPQQQGGWSQSGNRGGKRKQDQRDQPQFYDEKRASKKQKQRKGKHSYAEEQEYLDDTYEPSYQEDSLMYDEEPTQETGVSKDGTEADVTQQLLDDLNVDTSTGVTQEPDDLASLPADPSTLPDLLRGQVRQGMTIAFKQLVMTAETNWQPLVSVYRTAIVIDVSESGEIEVILAKRDQQQPIAKSFDEYTGQRIYGKFEMPVDENDEEDVEPEHGGKLYLRHEEMMEPKIVQRPLEDKDATCESSEQRQNPTTEGSIKLSQGGESAAPEAQFSHVTETPVPSNATAASQTEEDFERENGGTMTIHNEVHQNLTPASKPLNMPVPNLHEGHNSLDLPYGEPTPNQKELEGQDSIEVIATTPAKSSTVHNETFNLPEGMSDASRERILHMINEAGFGSSVSSSINRIIRPDGMESPSDAAIFEKLRIDMLETPIAAPYSPKFNGIDSSSPIRNLGDHLQSPREDGLESSSSTPKPQSSWQTVGSDELSSPIIDGRGSQGLVEPFRNVVGDEESWEDVQEAERTRRPSPPEHRRKSIKKEITNILATSTLPDIRRMWEQSKQQNSRQTSVRASIEEMSEISGSSSVSNTALAAANETSHLIGYPEPLSIDLSAELDQVEYPKLSIGSSFTSHVSDHGRQPDVHSDIGEALNADIPSAPNKTESSIGPLYDSSHPDDAMIDVEPDPKLPPSHQPVSGDTFVRHQEPKSGPMAEKSPHSSHSSGYMNDSNYSASDRVRCPVCQCGFAGQKDVEAHISVCLDKPIIESEVEVSSSNAALAGSSPLLEEVESPELDGLNSESHVSSHASTESPEPVEDQSSDDFPDIDEFLATSQKAKERPAAIGNADACSDEEQTTPKPSPHTRIPQSRSPVHVPLPASQVLKTQSQALPPRTLSTFLPKISSSQPVKKVVPKNAIVWDLTISSDVEPESDRDEPEASNAQFKRAKTEVETYEIGSSSQEYVENSQAKSRHLDGDDKDYQARNTNHTHNSKRYEAKNQKSKRHTIGSANSLRTSSQAEVNSKNTKRVR